MARGFLIFDFEPPGPFKASLSNHERTSLRQDQDRLTCRQLKGLGKGLLDCQNAVTYNHFSQQTTLRKPGRRTRGIRR